MRTRKKKSEEPGLGRILEAWTAPPDAGGPIGCLATTFTFDAGFFEEHCVGRFLAIDSVPDESGAAYLIEREEKLRQSYVGVVVDRAHAADERSLSWDLLNVRVAAGCMHAKVSLLAWANHVRVIVASANLTEAGYRSNLETYAMLDFADGAGEDRAVLLEVLAFLQSLVALSLEPAAKQRALDFITRVRALANDWADPRRDAGQPEVRLIINGDLGAGPQSALATLRSRGWKDQGPPRVASVISPFFDADPAPTLAALEGVLAQRGGTEIEFWVAAKELADGRLEVQAPAGLASDDRVLFRLVTDHEAEVRQLHAKALWLENERCVTWMIGSSNFTSAGLGVEVTGNIEANLAFMTRTGGDIEKAFRDTFPPRHDDAIDPKNAIFVPAFDQDRAGLLGEDTLPVAFLSATWFAEEAGSRVEVLLDPERLPLSWSIWDADEKRLRAAAGQQPTERLVIPWSAPKPPSLLEVRWAGKDAVERSAMLVVNVDDRAALPLPEELRQLSLETLLQILTMSRPMHEAIAAELERQAAARGDATLADLDPHRRVDTDSFLLQRTKRFAHAVEGLRRRLEEPVYSLEALKWRVHGPTGPAAVISAVEREAATSGERCFLLSELALLLARARPRAATGTISETVVRGELAEVAAGLRSRVEPLLPSLAPELAQYVKRAFAEAAS